eukprot:4455078-Amphidinium_carterae.1
MQQDNIAGTSRALVACNAPAMIAVPFRLHAAVAVVVSMLGTSLPSADGMFDTVLQIGTGFRSYAYAMGVHIRDSARVWVGMSDSMVNKALSIAMYSNFKVVFVDVACINPLALGTD